MPYLFSIVLLFMLKMLFSFNFYCFILFFLSIMMNIERSNYYYWHLDHCSLLGKKIITSLLEFATLGCSVLYKHFMFSISHKMQLYIKCGCCLTQRNFVNVLTNTIRQFLCTLTMVKSPQKFRVHRSNGFKRLPVRSLSASACYSHLYNESAVLKRSVTNDQLHCIREEKDFPPWEEYYSCRGKILKV